MAFKPFNFSHVGRGNAFGECGQGNHINLVDTSDSSDTSTTSSSALIRSQSVPVLFPFGPLKCATPKDNLTAVKSFPAWAVTSIPLQSTESTTDVVADSIKPDNCQPNVVHSFGAVQLEDTSTSDDIPDYIAHKQVDNHPHKPTADLERFRFEVLAELDAIRANAVRAISDQAASFDLNELKAAIDAHCNHAKHKISLEVKDDVIVHIKQDLHSILDDLVHGDLENQIKAAVANHLDTAVEESIKAIQEAGALTLTAVDGRVAQNAEGNSLAELNQLKRQQNVLKDRIAKLESQVMQVADLLTNLVSAINKK